MASPSWVVRGYQGWRAYAIATAFVACVVAARVALGGVLLQNVPFLPFMLAVLGSSLVGGLRVGMYATLLSAVVGEVLFVRPYGVSVFTDLIETLRFGIFVVAGTITSSVVELLRQARAEAWRANEEKDVFIAMLAHEFRNPINAVQTAVGALKARNADERREWAHAIIERQTAIMSRLVDDLLDAARIRRQAFDDIRSQPTALMPIIESAIASVQPLIVEHRLHLVTDLTDDAIVLADPMRLQQAIANLLSNACRYTPAGGRVSLTMTVSTNVTLTIEDTGIGIPSAHLARLFEPFHRGPQSAGLGLGLFLARTFVQYCGGTLEAMSGGEGAGSTFTITLPLLKRSPLQQEIAPQARSAGA